MLAMGWGSFRRLSTILILLLFIAFPSSDASALETPNLEEQENLLVPCQFFHPVMILVEVFPVPGVQLCYRVWEMIGLTFTTDYLLEFVSTGARMRVPTNDFFETYGFVRYGKAFHVPRHHRFFSFGAGLDFGKFYLEIGSQYYRFSAVGKTPGVSGLVGLKVANF